MTIRDMQEEDLVQVNELFNWYVENGFSTFLSPKTMGDRILWFEKFQGSKKEKALVAVDELGTVLGFTCSSMYRMGEVFERTVEASIYLKSDQRGIGIGYQLYEKLFQELKGTGAHRVVVGIALPNEASIALHEKCGFSKVGVFDEYAFYKGAYRSSLWMIKKID